MLIPWRVRILGPRHFQAAIPFIKDPKAQPSGKLTLPWKSQIFPSKCLWRCWIFHGKQDPWMKVMSSFCSLDAAVFLTLETWKRWILLQDGHPVGIYNIIIPIIWSYSLSFFNFRSIFPVKPITSQLNSRGFGPPDRQQKQNRKRQLTHLLFCLQDVAIPYCFCSTPTTLGGWVPNINVCQNKLARLTINRHQKSTLKNQKAKSNTKVSNLLVSHEILPFASHETWTNQDGS